MKWIIKSMVLLTAIQSCTSPSWPQVEIQGEFRKWHKITLLVEGPKTSEYARDNVFLNYRLEALFKNGDRSYKVPGFYAADGNVAHSSSEQGKYWKIIFRPDAVGEWSYEISFRSGDVIAVSQNAEGLPLPADGATGKFSIVESDKKGRDFRAKGRILNGGKGYFKCAETNELFVKNGTNSPENFLAYYDFDQTKRFVNQEIRDGEDNADENLHRYQPHGMDWKPTDPTWGNGKGKNIIGAVNYLADQGLNSMYMLTLNILGDGKDVWPYSDHNERYRFDCSKLEQWEVVFDHMEQRGVMVHFVLQETENECLLDNGYTEVQRKIYLRELTARFGHHLGVIWNLGEENGPTDWSPIGQTDQQRRDMANYIKAINPYNPIVVLHTHAGDHEQDKYLNPLIAYENLDGASMQISNPERVNQRINTFVHRSKKGEKPWLVSLDELGPHWKGVVPDSHDALHDTIRHHALWGTLMAGGAGVEWYFGWKYPEADLRLEDFRSRHNWWRQSTLATDFLGQYPLEFMQASNDVISSGNALCLSKPGEIYLIYIPDAREHVVLTLEQNQKMNIEWFDVRKGGDLQGEKIINVEQKGSFQLGPPPEDSGKDWLVVIKTANQ